MSRLEIMAAFVGSLVAIRRYRGPRQGPCPSGRDRGGLEPSPRTPQGPATRSNHENGGTPSWACRRISPSPHRPRHGPVTRPAGRHTAWPPHRPAGRDTARPWRRRTTPARTRPRRSHVVVRRLAREDRKSTRLNSSHVKISYAVFCLKK